MQKSHILHKGHLQMLPSYLFSVLGGIICATNLNTVIVPLKLYNDGFIGIAQILPDLIINVLHLNIPQAFNLAGMMMLVLSIPPLLPVYRETGHTSFLETILTVASQSMAMTIIPVPSAPIIGDYLTACVIGGLIANSGIGLTLRSGDSGGRTDIIGAYCTKEFPDMSVGKLDISVSSIVFSYCLLCFGVEVVVYSAIFSVAASLVVDKTHYQNIKSSAMIFTKHPEVTDTIVQLLHRGVTCWQGYGVYTHGQSYIFITVVSKLEIGRMKRTVRDIDPQAFIIINGRLDISNGFVKRL